MLQNKNWQLRKMSPVLTRERGGGQLSSFVSQPFTLVLKQS